MLLLLVRYIGYAGPVAAMRSNTLMKTRAVVFILLLTVLGCTPTVQMAAPKEPIEINLNVKIEHHIRVQVDKELEDIFEEDSELF